MKKKNRGHYLKIVEWSDDDGCFVGSCPPIIGPCCHGQDEVKVYTELSTIVDEWITTMKRDGVPLPKEHSAKAYSGKIPLRIAPELHKAVAVRALRIGESVNAYVAHCLKTIVEK